MKGTRKFSERWIRVANIGNDRHHQERIALQDKGSSAGSVRSSRTMMTNLGDVSGRMSMERESGGSEGRCSPGAESSPTAMVRLLLEDFTQAVRDNSAILYETDREDATVLHHAARTGRKDLVDCIINYGGDVSALDCFNDTPLHWAVRGNSTDTVHCLMYAGAEHAMLNKNKMAPLHLACDLDLPDMVEALCRHEDVDVNVPGEYGQTPLHYCAIKNSHAAAKKILNYKPRFCHRDDNGVYVIHCAATHASREVLNMLLEQAEEAGYPRDYVLRQNDKENNTALHSAVNSGSEEAVRVCIEFGSPLDVLQEAGYPRDYVLRQNDKENNTALHSAVNSGSEEAVRVCIEFGSPLDVLQEDCSTPLHLAASQGSLPIVQLLLGPEESKKTLSMRDVEKMTPLHRAAMFDHVDVVDFLVSKGADMNAVDKSGYSPLLRAVSRGSFRSATLLGKYGADFNLRDSHNRNILHLAVLSGKSLNAYGLITCKSEMKILLNDVDNRGCTPIHYATQHGNIKSVQSLIELGATVNLKDCQKQSPLHFAAKYGRFNSCKRLLDSSIGPNIINDIDFEGMTALHIAALNGHKKVIQLLLLRGALLHRDYKGRTPLHLAAMAGFLECMKGLLTTHGYLLDQADDDGDTALLLAAKEGQPQSVDFLLTHDASLRVNNMQQGPMAAAVATNNVEVAQEIVAHDRWQDVLDVFIEEQSDTCRTLIRNMPEVYKKILDRSITRSPDPPNSRDFWIKYDFKHLQPPLEERIKKKQAGAPFAPLHSLNLIIENNHMDLLSHPVCVEYINMKWKSYGAAIHACGMALHLFFVVCFTMFVLKSDKYYEKVAAGQNMSDTGNSTTRPRTETDKLEEWLGALALIMCIYAGINILKEIAQIYQQPMKYFKDYINYLEWGLYVCTLVFTVPFVMGARRSNETTIFEAQWQCGAVASFLAWFLMLLYQQRINVIGIYVVMFQVTLRTLVRVIIVFVMLIVAFSMALYMLMRVEDNHAFSSIPFAIFRVYTMMLAEIDYINSFVAPSKDEHEETMKFQHLTFAFLALLVLFLPIILMNLLIGLAVGDIATVQQDAKLQRLAMQVEMHTEMEEKIPAKILEWVDMDYVLIFPNKRTSPRYGNKLLSTFRRYMYGNERDENAIEVTKTTIEHLKGEQENAECNTHINAMKNKMKTLSDQMEKQHDLLRLIVQKMEISTEADDQDEGIAPPLDQCYGRLRVDLGQVVRAAAMMREGARQRMTLYNGATTTKARSTSSPPEPSV